MPKPKPNTHIKPSEDRLETVEQAIEDLATDVGSLRRELAAAGVGRAPNPARSGPLPKEQRRAINARNAARARAAKTVGKGYGHVRTAATKRRLQRAAADVTEEDPE